MVRETMHDGAEFFFFYSFPLVSSSLARNPVCIHIVELRQSSRASYVAASPLHMYLNGKWRRVLLHCRAQAELTFFGLLCCWHAGGFFLPDNCSVTPCPFCICCGSASFGQAHATGDQCCQSVQNDFVSYKAALSYSGKEGEEDHAVDHARLGPFAPFETGHSVACNCAMGDRLIKYVYGKASSLSVITADIDVG